LHDPLQSISVGKKAAKNFPASAAWQDIQLNYFHQYELYYRQLH
jgi:hypothetical protein